MNEPRLAASDSELASLQTARKEKFGALARFLRSRTFGRLRNVDRGRLTMTDAIGSEVFGSTDASCGLEVTLTINDPTAYSDIATGCSEAAWG